ncbi:MAG: glycosyltransferase family 87 protein [Desulfobaccales bacterium]
MKYSWNNFALLLISIILGLLFIPLYLYNVLCFSIGNTYCHTNDFGKMFNTTQSLLNGKIDGYINSPTTLTLLSKYWYDYLLNMNPPHLHFIMLPLIYFNIHTAFMIWMSINGICLIISLILIIRESGIKLNPSRGFFIIFGVLILASTTANLPTGQLSFFLLLPITLAWIAARRGNWEVMGLFMGLAVSVKLFLLIFLPYLALRRQFRALAVTCLTVSACFAAGVLVFGMEAHRAWIRALSSVSWAWIPTNLSVMGFLTRAISQSPGFMPIFNAPGLIKPLWFVGAGLLGLITLAVAALDTTDHAVDRGFALLLLGALLISPLGWVYYLWFAMGPSVILVKSCYETNKLADSPKGSRVRLRNCLFIAAIPGLVWPILGLFWFEPSIWATILIGSIYFWTVLALWLSLLADWVEASGNFSPMIISRLFYLKGSAR